MITIPSFFRRALLVFALSTVSAALAALGLLYHGGVPSNPKSVAPSTSSLVSLPGYSHYVQQAPADESGVAASNLEQSLGPADALVPLPEPVRPVSQRSAAPHEVGMGQTAIAGLGYRLDLQGGARSAAAVAKQIRAYRWAPRGLGAIRFPTPPSNPPQTEVDPTVLGVWAGLGGHRRGLGGFVPVIARLRGGTLPFQGLAQVTSGSQAWAASVRLQPGETKSVELDPDLSADVDGDVTEERWTLETGTGRVLCEERIRVDVEQRDSCYLLSDVMLKVSGLNPVLFVRGWLDDSEYHEGSDTFPAQIPLIPSALAPTSPLGWSAARLVVLDPNAHLSAAARRALMDWVRAGGVLMVAVPANTSRAVHPELSTLGAGWIRKMPFKVDPGEPGAGMAGWFATADWDRMTPDSAMVSVTPPAASPPALYFPSWPMLVLIGLGYAAVFGPFSLWMMRRVRRVLHVWMVAPVLAILLTSGIFLWGRHFRHTMRTLNANSVILTVPGSTRGFEKTEMMLFRPDPGGFRVNLGCLQISEGNAATGSIVDVESGGSHTAVLQDLPGYEPDTVSACGMVDLGGGASFHVAAGGAVSLVNHTGQALGPGLIQVGPANYYRTPALGPGQRALLPATGWFESAKPPLSSALTDAVAEMDLSGWKTNARWMAPIGFPEPWDLLAPGQRQTELCVAGGGPTPGIHLHPGK